MYKKSGMLLLCVLMFAFSTVAQGEGIGSLMSSIDNYPEEAAPELTKQPAGQQPTAPNEAAHRDVAPNDPLLGEAEKAPGDSGDDRQVIDSQVERDLVKPDAETGTTDGEDTQLEPLQIINEIEGPGLVFEALTGSGANTITVTYVAADEAVGRLDVFAECQNPGVTETWYSEIVNLEIGQTGVFVLPDEEDYEYRVCVVSSVGSGIIVLSVSTQ